MPGDYRTQLYLLCDELKQLAVEIAAAANVKIGQQGSADPKVIALAILCRTRSNFGGAVMLVKERRVVEARVLARCCFENMFLVGGLATEGDRFVKLMQDDEAESRKRRAKLALDMDQFASLAPDVQQRLTAFVEATKEMPRGKMLMPKAASEKSAFKLAYIAYSQFSSDAAHASLHALQRYLTTSDGPCITIEPEPTEHELDETLHLSCTAFLGVLVGANQILGGTEPGRRLDPMSDKFKRLEIQRWGDGTSIAQGG